MLKSDRVHDWLMPSREIKRKSVHIIAGIIIAYLVLLLTREVLIFLTVIGLVSTLLISCLVKKGFNIPVIDWILESCERESAMMKLPGKGVIMFISSLLILLLIIHDPVIVASAILTLGLGDGFATIVGKNLGKHRLIGKKSIEGSLAFFCASFIGLLFLLGPRFAIIAAFCGMLIEIIPQEIVDDNLTIPLGVGLILMILVGVGGGGSSI